MLIQKDCYTRKWQYDWLYIWTDCGMWHWHHAMHTWHLTNWRPFPLQVILSQSDACLWPLRQLMISVLITMIADLKNYGGSLSLLLNGQLLSTHVIYYETRQIIHILRRHDKLRFSGNLPWTNVSICYFLVNFSPYICIICSIGFLWMVIWNHGSFSGSCWKL